MTLKKGLKMVAVPVLLGSFVLLSFVGLQAQGNRVKQTDANNRGSIYVGEQGKGTVQGNAELAGQAKITATDAVKAAEGAYPGYTANGVGIENENGYLIYSVKMFDKSGKVLDVKVDAGDAKILAVDKSADNDSETNDSRRESEKNENESENEHENRHDTDNEQNDQHGEHEG